MKAEEKLNSPLSTNEQVVKTMAKDHGFPAFKPFKPQTILVPVEDTSACSQKAIQYAIPFAGELAARIAFLCILPAQRVPGWKCNPVMNEWFLDTSLQQEVEQRLGKLVHRIVPVEIPRRFMCAMARLRLKS